MSSIKLNTEGLDKILKSLQTSGAGQLPKTRVGILASTDHRSDGYGNAEIGAIHEFGDTTHPQRSFLRVPLAENLDKYLEKSGAFNENSLKDVVSTGSIAVWMKKLGVIAVNVVKDGFGTGGFGKWAPWRGNYKSKTGQILVDSTQLRDSITYDVK